MQNHARLRPRVRIGTLIGLCLTLLAAPASAQEAGYLDHDGLTDALRSLVDGNSSLARMSEIGRSAEGREIWLIEVANPDGTPVADRPAVLIAAQLEGSQHFGSMMALETLEYLLGEYASNPEVQAQLDRHVFYIVPRVNPDGAEAYFGETLIERRRNMRPYDDDNDARTDEDGGDDLNGDGYITVMRVPVAGGTYTTHADDPRFLVPNDPTEGTSGMYEVYWEGLDDDGDGFYNEDGVGGVDLNRNFQHVYPYWEADAGPHMVSEPESRALMDFTISHRNISAILTFGESDNLVTPISGQGRVASESTLDLIAFADESFDGIYDVGVVQTGFGFGFGFGRGGGPGGSGAGGGGGQRPAEVVNPQDREYFRTVSDAYKETTGLTGTLQTRAPEGAFFQYGYFQFGVPSFSTPGWGVTEGSVEGGDAGIVEAVEAMGGNAFVDWTPFDHPTLGAVEIGGFVPYAASVPPVEHVEAMGAAHGAFATHLASLLPEVVIASTEVTDHGGGIFEISVEVENRGFFPTSTRHGVVSGSVDAVLVQLDHPTEDIVTGDAKSSTIAQLAGSGSREQFSWIIRGNPGAEVEILVRAQKGGRDTATVTLR